MRWTAITKTPEEKARANLTDYQRACHDFRWADAAEPLAGLPDGRGLNIAYEAVDRHVVAGRGDKVALRGIGRDMSTTDITYTELRRLTNRFASMLDALGIGGAVAPTPSRYSGSGRTDAGSGSTDAGSGFTAENSAGERVFSLLPRGPDLYVTALGTLKHTSVFSPLFAAFGPEPVRQRMVLGDARVLVTTAELYARKIAPIRDTLPGLEHVLITGSGALPPGTRRLAEVLEEGTDTYEIPPTDPERLALLHFTSGTTGQPKGAMHVHQAVVAHHATALYALDLHGDDVFWCTADPGWVTGTSYGIIAPLTHGLTVLTDTAEFEARRWYQILQDQRVTVWYTAPTALRMLMRHGPELARGYDLSALRFVASVGEPLNPEVVAWGQKVLDRAIHDNWWQTETGAIMISNYAAVDVRPGSMGLPLPGVTAAVLARGADGRAAVHDGGVRIIDQPGETGELALRGGWPSMFRGYLGEEKRYRRCFVDGWYLTGDLAARDVDGYYWFVGRADDVIKSAGHLIGPFEVESALMEHPAVAEAGVIGKPDPVAGEVVKAFVTLRPSYPDSDETRLDLLAFGRRRLGGMAPKEIVFAKDLPHTRSGKVMRRLLKARELGLPEGDLSTLEGSG